LSLPINEVLARAQRVRLVIFDVDGVLTDGRLHFTDDGAEHKVFDVRDGHGMKMLSETGVVLAVLSGRSSPAVERRMHGLGIARVYQGLFDKLPPFLALLSELGLDAEQAAYVGDDVVDLPVMLRVGLAIAVQDAHPMVVSRAHWRTVQGGGRGAAREVCELIMQAQGSWDAQIQKYLHGYS
jgi:3-deoxy-D-manno-octulosonate 8-phosphate phosphatase (KDO 8-P phosphatase)